MNDHQHHEDLIKAISLEYHDVLNSSAQGVYIYLDDKHKVCNEKFATLLGYQSAEEWAKVEDSFPDTFVAKDSQETLVSAYQNALEKKVGSTNKIVWKKKDGGNIATNVILVPISFQGHLFALHFVTV